MRSFIKAALILLGVVAVTPDHIDAGVKYSHAQEINLKSYTIIPQSEYEVGVLKEFQDEGGLNGVGIYFEAGKVGVKIPTQMLVPQNIVADVISAMTESGLRPTIQHDRVKIKFYGNHELRAFPSTASEFNWSDVRAFNKGKGGRQILQDSACAKLNETCLGTGCCQDSNLICDATREVCVSTRVSPSS